MNEEITLDVDPEVLAAWRTDPVTEKVMEFLERVGTAYKLAAFDMPTQSYSAERIALEYVKMQGRIEGLDEILNLKGGLNDEG